MGMPPNPPSKAHGFAMRSMSLLNMQIYKSEKILGPPCQILGTPLPPLILREFFKKMITYVIMYRLFLYRGGGGGVGSLYIHPTIGYVFSPIYKF